MEKFEKKRVDVVDNIVNDVNNAVRLFKKSNYSLNPDRFERLLLKVDTSVEKKKKELIKELYDSMIKTFSINPEKIDKEKLLKSLKDNVKIIRKLTKKINDINYYLSTTFLEEIGIIKKKRAFRQRNIKRLAEISFPINKEELEKLEHTVYKLIEKIIILDNTLLKKFRKKQEKIMGEKSFEVNDLESILKKETELLCHIEAKLPPAAKISPDLIKKPHFDYWVATVLALLTALKKEYGNELKIFNKLKKNQILKKKIDVKIKYLMKEKSDILKLKEGRILMAEKIGRMDGEWEKNIHEWLAVADL